LSFAFLWRKVVLAQVDTVGVASQGEVDAVIDDERGFAERDAAEFASMREKGPRGGRFVAILQDGHAGGEKLLGKVQHRSQRVRLGSEAGVVEDGVKRR
jgi:hypothetical protein